MTHRHPGDPLPTPQRIWNALSDAGSGAYLRYTLIAERARCSVSTVRKHIRAWSMAGYVKTRPGLSGQYGGSARIASRCHQAPRITYDCGGSLIYVSDPASIHVYTTINLNDDPPAVRHHDRRPS